MRVIRALEDMKSEWAFNYSQELTKPKAFYFQNENNMIKRAACVALGECANKISISLLLVLIKNRELLKLHKGEDILVENAAVGVLYSLKYPEVEKAIKDIISAED